MKLNVPYNTQRDNKAIAENWDGAGYFYGWAMCGPVTACMWLSNWIPEAATDAFVESYIRACEPRALPGPAKYAADIERAYPQVAGRHTAWMVTHRWMIEKLLMERGISLPIVYREDERGWRSESVTGEKVRMYGTWDDVRASLQTGNPVMIHGSPPPSEGHFFLIVGETDDGKSWICHDPYGDARKRYEPWSPNDGAFVEYSKEDMSAWCSVIGPDRLRILHTI